MARIIANGKVKENKFGLSGDYEITIEGEKYVKAVKCKDSTFRLAASEIIKEGYDLDESSWTTSLLFNCFMWFCLRLFHFSLPPPHLMRIKECPR